MFQVWGSLIVTWKYRFASPENLTLELVLFSSVHCDRRISFLYLGSSLKSAQGLIKGKASLDYGIKFDASKSLFRAKNSIKHLL